VSTSSTCRHCIGFVRAWSASAPPSSTRSGNQIRAFLLERGIAVRQGLRFLRQALPDILANRTDLLTPRMVNMIKDLACDLALPQPAHQPGDRISKRGNSYLRTLFVQAARVVLLRPTNWAKHSFGRWLEAAAKRMYHNVVATALANKLTRIAWSVLHHGHSYEPRISTELA